MSTKWRYSKSNYLIGLVCIVLSLIVPGHGVVLMLKQVIAPSTRTYVRTYIMIDDVVEELMLQYVIHGTDEHKVKVMLMSYLYVCT